jgi:hypothetical protein
MGQLAKPAVEVKTLNLNDIAKKSQVLINLASSYFLHLDSTAKRALRNCSALTLSKFATWMTGPCKQRQIFS